VWQVKSHGLLGRLYGVAWLAGSAILLAASLAATAFIGRLPGPLPLLAIVVTLPIDAVLWVWTFTVLTNREHGWRAYIPGAVVGAIGLEILKLVGTVYVPRLVGSSSALYGSLGVVFALIAWLALFARLTVYAAIVNVIRHEEDYGTSEAVILAPALPDGAPHTALRSGQVVNAPDSDSAQPEEERERQEAREQGEPEPARTTPEPVEAPR